MGAEPKRLGVPGEVELGGHGVSTCGVCDGAFFKGENVIVVGGGDSAMEDSIFIAKFAERLTIIHRRGEFRALEDHARARPRDREHRLQDPVRRRGVRRRRRRRIASVRLRNVETGAVEEMETGGAFVAIKHTPRSELVAGQVDTDENGYVLTEGRSTKTKLAGVFAAGDLVDHTYRQAVTAAGTGCMSALDAEWYLRDTPPSPEAHRFGKAGAPGGRAGRRRKGQGVESMAVVEKPEKLGLKPAGEFDEANETWPRGDRPAAIRAAAAEFRARFATEDNRVRGCAPWTSHRPGTRSSSCSVAPGAPTPTSTSSTGSRSSSSRTSRGAPDARLRADRSRGPGGGPFYHQQIERLGEFLSYKVLANIYNPFPRRSRRPASRRGRRLHQLRSPPRPGRASRSARASRSTARPARPGAVPEREAAHPAQGVGHFRSLHPMQWAWYVEDGIKGVPEENVVLLEGDVELGKGGADCDPGPHGRQPLAVHQHIRRRLGLVGERRLRRPCTRTCRRSPGCASSRSSSAARWC